MSIKVNVYFLKRGQRKVTLYIFELSYVLTNYIEQILETFETLRNSIYERRRVSKPTKCLMEFSQQRVTTKRSEIYIQLSWEYSGCSALFMKDYNQLFFVII